MRSMIGEPRVVEAGRGATWWAHGFHILKSSFWTWIGIMIIYIVLSMLMTAVTSVVPFLGNVGFWLLTPVFMGGLMIGCQSIENGGELRVAHLFEGFQGTHFVPLMIIGALNIALMLGVAAITAAGLFGTLTLAQMIAPGASGDPLEALRGSPMFTGTGVLTGVLVLVLLTAFTMLNWFAPALVALRGATAFEAMKLSFLACLRNWAPFLVYGLIGVAISVALTFIFGAGAAMVGAGVLMGASDLATGIGAILGLVVLFIVGFAIVAVVLGPIVFGSLYSGYKDTLGTDDTTIGNPAYQ